MMREWARFWETGRVDDYLTAKRSEAAQGRTGRGDSEGANSRWDGEKPCKDDERSDRATWNG